MRLGGNSRIGGTGTRLLHYGPVARENPGKIREITIIGDNHEGSKKKEKKITGYSKKLSSAIPCNDNIACFCFLSPSNL